MKSRGTLTKVCWTLASVSAEMLEPAERDVVRGDYAESGETALQALIGVWGLVGRRQLALWKDWHSWFALIGIVGAVGIPLSRIFLGYQKVFYGRAWGLLWGHPVNPFNFPGALAVALDLAYMVCLSLAIALWSSTSGFVLCHFSRRATWLTSIMFYFVVYDFAFLSAMRSRPTMEPISSIIADALLPDGPTMLLILLPVYWGARHGLRRGSVGLRRVLQLVIIIALVNSLALWMSSLYVRFEAVSSPGNPKMTTFVLLSWPACYMVAAEVWRRCRRKDGMELLAADHIDRRPPN